MCVWMGPYFHYWIDYNEVPFSIVTGVIFFCGKNSSVSRESKSKSESELGWERKNCILLKVTEMYSITGHKIVYNGVRVLRGQQHKLSKNYLKDTLPPEQVLSLFKCSQHQLCQL